MKTIDILDPTQIPGAVQARAFPIFDKRTPGVVEDLAITGLWELDNGEFAYDFGNINHTLYTAYIDDTNLELVIVDLVYAGDYVHDGETGHMTGMVNVVKRHSFSNVFEATEYYAKKMIVKMQREKAV